MQGKSNIIKNLVAKENKIESERSKENENLNIDQLKSKDKEESQTKEL